MLDEMAGFEVETPAFEALTEIASTMLGHISEEGFCQDKDAVLISCNIVSLGPTVWAFNRVTNESVNEG